MVSGGTITSSVALASPVALDPQTLLTRAVAAEALKAAGFPVTKATLATIASRRSDGPRFCRFGPRVLYRWGDLLEWAQAKLGPPATSTSQFDAARQPDRASAA